MSDLFLPGHKEYTFEIEPPEAGMTYPKNFKCPFCHNQFEKNVPRQTHMHLTKTEPDLRERYNGVEPVHFEIVTCFSCNYSAVASQFEKAKTLRNELLSEDISPYLGRYDFSGESITDINTMFAGFYLAALCAPVCFPNSDLIYARVWHRMSWLYSDCGDSDMSNAAAKKALEYYIESYDGSSPVNEQIIRVQLIIAELSYKLGDIKTAADFFMKVKTNKQSGSVYQRLAEDRITDIRNSNAV